jgi:pyridoxine 5-phosphate synthase
VIRLGVNVDHVATVRQARRGKRPDPVEAALEARQAGADSIVCHLREDRRHIQDRDLAGLLRRAGPVNLEMGLAPEIVRIALRARPWRVTLVPERRQELTTEGGLDVADRLSRVRDAVIRFHDRGVGASLFIDPDPRQVNAAIATGARVVELHTGAYAEASGVAARRRELSKLAAAARQAHAAGLEVAAGHGLDYDNVTPVAAVPEIVELNIGHSIVSLAVFTGFGEAVRRMKELMRGAR